jgi:hypothetical protein
MGFTEGKRKEFRVMFNIKAKTKSQPARERELKRFFANLKKLAKKFSGSETHTR